MSEATCKTCSDQPSIYAAMTTAKLIELASVSENDDSSPLAPWHERREAVAAELESRGVNVWCGEHQPQEKE